MTRTDLHGSARRVFAAAAIVLFSAAAAPGGDPIRGAIERDWADQDGLYASGRLRPEAVRKPIDELGEAGTKLLAEHKLLAARGFGHGASVAHATCRHRPGLPHGIVVTIPAPLGPSRGLWTESIGDRSATAQTSPRPSKATSRAITFRR